MISPWSWWKDLFEYDRAPLPDLPPMPGAVQSVRVRERRELDGKVVSRREVKVKVRPGGHVEIEGDCASLTINGRRVRFREPETR